MSQLAQRLLDCEVAQRSRATLAERDTIHIEIDDYATEYEKYEQAESIVVGLAKILGAAAFVFLITLAMFAIAWRQ